MGDWIGLGVIGLIVLGGLIGLSVLGKPYEATAEEFEQRAQEGPGLMSAGVIGLQKILDPSAAHAAVVQEDFKQGFYDSEQESGDQPEPGSTNRSPVNANHEEGGDA